VGDEGDEIGVPHAAFARPALIQKRADRLDDGKIAALRPTADVVALAAPTVQHRVFQRAVNRLGTLALTQI
jgi:hypothetical protein